MVEPDHPKQALWDFALQFVTPTARRYLNDPAAGVALELGSTDGRRAEAAASFFRRVIAVDVAAMHELKLPGSKRSPNVELVVRDSAQIPVETSSIDFVFTLRGLTWFSSIDAFDNEFGEVARVLRPGGVATLWYGRISRLPIVISPKTLLHGYSHDARAAIPLKVRQSRVRRSLRKAGLKHVALSTPLHPDTSWRLFRGGELSYVTVVKPA